MTAFLATSSTDVQAWAWAVVCVAIGVILWAIAADLGERKDDARDR